MIEELREWRRERGLGKSNYKAYFANVIEELLEPLYDDSSVINYFKNEIVGKYYREINLDDEKIIDTLNDITVFSVNEAEMMGYDFDKTMDETIKEISSRTGEYNEEVGKWQKFKTPEAVAKWYKADYSKCKVTI